MLETEAALDAVSVRPATPDDLLTLLEFLRLKADFDGCPEALDADPARLSEHLFGETPLAGVLLAERNDSPVGFATYYRTYSTFLARPGLWLDDLYVLESERGRGVGRLLLKRLAGMTQQMGGGRLEWTAARANERGLAFYQRNGAKRRETVHLLRLDRTAMDALTTE